MSFPFGVKGGGRLWFFGLEDGLYGHQASLFLPNFLLATRYANPRTLNRPTIGLFLYQKTNMAIHIPHSTCSYWAFQYLPPLTTFAYFRPLINILMKRYPTLKRWQVATKMRTGNLMSLANTDMFSIQVQIGIYTSYNSFIL